jgi:hypothetical protein
VRYAIVAVPPALCAAVLAAFWLQTTRLPLTGDEPHYVVMALSLLEDGDLRLQNNYDIECVAAEFYGCMEPHAFRQSHGWVPYHQPGLSALIAGPYAAAHVIGARLAMVALAALLPVLVLAWFDSTVGGDEAMWAALAATLSMPFLFGASSIYPDLVAGVATFAMTIFVLRQPTRSTAAWLAFWAACGGLCWLNLKFIGASAVLGAWTLFRAGRPSRRELLCAAAALIGPMTLAAFHYWAFGNVLGLRGARELTDSPLRASMIFLGLHLDQGQGLFLQHPFLFAGVPAFVLWARRDPTNAIWWLVLYASLIVPNSLQMGRYGGSGPAGRYAWTAAWLWLIPLACTWRQGSWIKPLAIASIAYQLALAVRWMPAPRLLLPVYAEGLAERNSLYPEGARWLLPSFYDWTYSHYLTHPPNVLAIALVAAALVFAAVAARAAPGPRTIRRSPGS